MGESANTDKAPKKSFIKGLKSEFNKIIWPDQDTVKKQTVAVLTVSVALGAIIAILDAVILFGLKLVI